MSLATRCTHCGTIFKVVQDQLKVSEGWVRCGRCHEVFNAMPALFDLDSESPPPRRTAPPPAHQAAPQPAPAPTPAPTPTPQADPAESGAATWSATRPTELAPPTPIGAHTPLSAADLNSAPTSLPSATEFDLDTSVQVPLNEPRPWDGPPPQEVPDTDESDALDSRYLMPSQGGPRQVKRRPQGPEFADAQFPNDAMIDAEEDWALDSIPAELPPEPARPVHMPAPIAAPAPRPVSVPAPPTPRIANANANAAEDADADAADDPTIPTTLPSRFGEDFVPEQVQPPPSKRQGRSGTRGRDPATQAPEFVKRAQRQAFWRHPAMRAALLTLLLGLTLGLGLQLAHQFRDLIAAYHPESRPLLQAWCDEVGCKIAPPLRLEALQVDSATLLRTASEGPDRYRLTVSVNNRSDIAVAWPHIDLSLTDDSGSVIARRAFQATDARVVRGDGVGQALTPVPPSAPAQQSTTLQWSLRLDGLTPAGYTAEIFYP